MLAWFTESQWDFSVVALSLFTILREGQLEEILIGGDYLVRDLIDSCIVPEKVNLERIDVIGNYFTAAKG